MEVIFHPSVAKESREAAKYYDAQQPGLGDSFLEALMRGIKNLAERPLRWRPIDETYRRCRVDRFPFDIIFHFDRARIYVVAISHNRRNSGYWNDRIEDLFQ